MTVARDDRPAQVIARVMRRTGLGFPRGMLGEDTARLAALLDRPEVNPIELETQITVATTALWRHLQAPVASAIRMHLSRADGQDREDLGQVLEWAHRDDDGNPLARALTVRAAREFGAAVRHAEDQLRAVEGVVGHGGPAGAVAAARALGAAVVALLDLDPEDFAPEIADYVDQDQSAEALDVVARATGDRETRAWARDALAALDVADAPDATDAVQQLADGEPPEDPAQDAVWVPVILALVAEGLERALAYEAESAG